MGNKEAKIKKVFEEIDTSGDEKISVTELVNYLEPKKNEKVGEVISKLTKEERGELSSELMTLGKCDKNNDGKLSFEEFMAAIKEKETMKKFILKMAKA